MSREGREEKILTKKAKPPPTRDANRPALRDGTESVTGVGSGDLLGHMVNLS
jgi:hypothetical protein